MRRRVGGNRGSGTDVRSKPSFLTRVAEVGFGLLRGGGRRRVAGSFLSARGIHDVGVGLLLLVERLEQRGALLWRRLHERYVARFSTGVVELLHAVAKDLLFLRVVAIGHHYGDERTDFRRLCPGRLGLGQNRLGDLVEERHVAGCEFADVLARCYRLVSLLARAQQRRAADERYSTEEQADASDRLASVDRSDFLRAIDHLVTVRHRILSPIRGYAY